MNDDNNNWQYTLLLHVFVVYLYVFAVRFKYVTCELNKWIAKLKFASEKISHVIL